MTTAIILAAGKSSRMSPLTHGEAKCLLTMGGRSLLQQNIDALALSAVDRIVVVRGQNTSLPIDPRCVAVDGVPHAGMVSSLLLARDYLTEDVLVVYADVAFDPSVMGTLLSSRTGDAVVPVDIEWTKVFGHRCEDPYLEAETCVYGSDGRLFELGGSPATPEDTMAQFIGMFWLGSTLAQSLAAVWIENGGDSLSSPWHRYYSTDLLMYLINAGWDVRVLPIRGGWFEFDSPVDYARALELQGTPGFQFLGSGG